MKTPVTESDPLDDILLSWSEEDVFSIRDACEGVQIFGGIGSGKTTGSGATLARAYLSHGFGGLVLTAKPDECETWKRYARNCGREHDLIILSPESGQAFDFMDYEFKRQGRGTGLTGNLVELFMVVANTSNLGGGGTNEAFWNNELRKLMRNAFDLQAIVEGSVDLRAVYELIISAPLSTKQLESTAWKDKSYCYKLLFNLQMLFKEENFPVNKRRDASATLSFWLVEFPNMSDKTRATVISSFTSMADGLLRTPLYELFCRETTFTPDDSAKGKIIVLDLPVKEFHETGRNAQIIVKYIWQRAMERRRVGRLTRPVFLWADECQHFVNEHDVTFQATSRSSRACTVFLTQNLPNYHAAVGGSPKQEAMVESLLGNLSTKIFHNNTDTKTNTWASQVYAEDYVSKTSSSFQVGDQSSPNISHSYDQEKRFTVMPREFFGLLKGGPNNDYQVEALIHQAGKVFSGSQINALKTTFTQQA